MSEASEPGPPRCFLLDTPGIQLFLGTSLDRPDLLLEAGRAELGIVASHASS